MVLERAAQMAYWVKPFGGRLVLWVWGGRVIVRMGRGCGFRLGEGGGWEEKRRGYVPEQSKPPFEGPEQPPPPQT